MEIMIITMKIVGAVAGLVIYIKGGLLTMEHYFGFTNLIKEI